MIPYPYIGPKLITLPVDTLAPNGARILADTVQTKNLDMTLFEV